MSKVPPIEWMYPSTYEQFKNKVYESFDNETIRILPTGYVYERMLDKELYLYRYFITIVTYDENFKEVDIIKTWIETAVNTVRDQELYNILKKNKLLYHNIVPKNNNNENY